MNLPFHSNSLCIRCDLTLNDEILILKIRKKLIGSSLFIVRLSTIMYLIKVYFSVHILVNSSLQVRNVFPFEKDLHKTMAYVSTIIMIDFTNLIT